MKKVILFFIILSNIFTENISTLGQKYLENIKSFREVRSYNKQDLEFIESLANKEFYIGIKNGKSLLDYDLDEKNLDFLRFITKSLEKHLGIKFNYIFAETYTQLEEMLGEGQIDLIFSSTKKVNKEKVYSLPFLSEKVGLISKSKSLDDIDILYVREDSFESQKLDFLFEKLNGTFNYKIIKVDKLDFALLNNDKVGFWDTEYSIKYLIEQNFSGVVFSPYLNMPIEIRFRPELNPYFIEIINKTFDIYLSNVIRDLYTLIIKDNNNNLFIKNLTDAEKEYLAKNVEFKLHIQDNHFPYLFFNEQKEKYEGLFIDILEEFLEVSNQKLVLEKGQSRDESYQLFLEEKKGFLFTSEYALTKTMSKSKSLFKEEVILIGTLNSKVFTIKPLDYFGNYIGVVNNKITKAIIDEYGNEIENQIIYYADYDQLIKALEEEKIQYAMIYKGIYEFYKTFEQKHFLKEIALFSSFDIYLASDKINKMQIDIFNKGIETSIIDLDIYYNRWKTYNTDFEYIIAKQKDRIREELLKQKKILKYLIFLSSALIIAIISVIYTFLKVRRVNKLLFKEMYFEPDFNIPNKRKFFEERDSLQLGEYDSVACLVIKNQLEINQLYTFEENEDFRFQIGQVLKEMKKINYIDEMYYVNNICLLIIRNNKENFSLGKIRSILDKLNEKLNSKIKFKISYASSEFERYNFEKVFEKAYFLINSDNNVEIIEATSKILDDEKELLFLANDLPRAIEDNEILPYFQPKVSCKTGKIRGVEALARWNHKEKGIIAPFKFIPRAEENGNIIDIDLAIAERAISKFKQWKIKKYINDDFIMSFNLSPKTLMLQDIDSKIASFLNKYRVKPREIEIEVTERVVINNYEHFINIISKFREMGIYVAIDDFSAGNASLDYILKIDFTTLKIDRSLLVGMVKENNNKKKEIYKAVVDIGKKLNMKLVAEGVEEVEEVELVKSLNVDEIQGYYYSKPLSEGGLIEFLKSF